MIELSNNSNCQAPQQHNNKTNFFIGRIRQRAKEIGDTFVEHIATPIIIHKQQPIAQQNYANEERQLRLWFEQEQLRLAKQESMLTMRQEAKELNRRTIRVATTKPTTSSQSSRARPMIVTTQQQQLDKIMARLKQVRNNTSNTSNDNKDGIARLRAAVAVS